MSTATAPEYGASGYWYPDSDHAVTAVDTLTALRRYRAAESLMRRRTRESMRMGETDLAAIRYLLAAQRRGQNVSPKDLAANLDISSASVSVMIDRLEKSGHVSRRRHPTDGRGVVVVATEDSETEVRETLGIMHARMLAVAESLSPAETAAVARFLTEMAVAIEDLSSESS